MRRIPHYACHPVQGVAVGREGQAAFGQRSGGVAKFVKEGNGARVRRQRIFMNLEDRAIYGCISLYFFAN
jgi:hypothetical protein